MWRGSKRFLLGLALLLLWLPYSYSVEDECEALLDECVLQLETLTNELENSLNLISRYESLNNSQSLLITTQQNTMNAQNERLNQAESLLRDYEREERRKNLRSHIHAAGSGILLGIVVGLVFF